MPKPWNTDSELSSSIHISMICWCACSDPASNLSCTANAMGGADSVSPQQRAKEGKCFQEPQGLRSLLAKAVALT